MLKVSGFFLLLLAPMGCSNDASMLNSAKVKFPKTTRALQVEVTSSSQIAAYREPEENFFCSAMKHPSCLNYVQVFLRCACRGGEDESLAQCQSALRASVLERVCNFSEEAASETTEMHCKILAENLKTELPKSLTTQCF